MPVRRSIKRVALRRNPFTEPPLFSPSFSNVTAFTGTVVFAAASVDTYAGAALEVTAKLLRAGLSVFLVTWGCSATVFSFSTTGRLLVLFVATAVITSVWGFEKVGSCVFLVVCFT